MTEEEDMIIEGLSEELAEVSEQLSKIQNVEGHLRGKCHRYRKHIKDMERGIGWRNKVITELLFRLGYRDEEITMSVEDFEKLLG